MAKLLHHLVSLLVIAALMIGVTPLLAEGTNTPDPIPPNDIGSPFLLILAFWLLVMVVVFVLLLGIGLAVGIVLCALVGALTAFGILSTSVAIGFLRRSPASGLRALFLQLGAVVGVVCGIAASWLVSWLAHSHWGVVTRLLVGGSCGLICGILVAGLFNLAWGKITAWILARFDGKQAGTNAIDV
jgi:hypothetical protein